MMAMVGFLSVSTVTAMLEISHTPKNRMAAATAAPRMRIITSGLAANSNKGANHRNIRAPIRGFLINMKHLPPDNVPAGLEKYLDHEHVDVADGLFVPTLGDGRTHGAPHRFRDFVWVAPSRLRQRVERFLDRFTGDIGHRPSGCVGFRNADQLDLRVGNQHP